MTELAVPVLKLTPVKYLNADMGVRYWEDGKVNGIEGDGDNPAMPHRRGDAWVLKIDLETGAVVDWPKGVVADVHYKVCDAGVYTLSNADGEQVVQKDGYVPSMLSIGSDGYGDYVIIKINGDGLIENFEADLTYFEPDN